MTPCPPPARMLNLVYPRPVPLEALVDPAGAATPRARALDGVRITLEGYLAPSLMARPGGLLLTERSLAPCRLCGDIHGTEAGILVVPRAPAGHAAGPAAGMDTAVSVQGRLRIAEGAAMLIDAAVRLRAAPACGAAARAWLGAWLDADPDRPGGPPPRRPAARDRVPATGTGAAADILLRGGRVRVVDEAFSTVEAVAVRGGRFLAVGDDASVAKHAGPGTEIFDLAGRTVVPGLIDSHIHQFYVGLNAPTVQLLAARSVADVQARIAERAAETPRGAWIVGSSGWHESLLAEGRMPTRRELDEAAPDHPVLIPRGGHVVTVNSPALARAGVTRETPDPAGGVIVRDPGTGEATGVLLETAAYFARRVAPPAPSADRMAELLRGAMAELNGFGITAAVDPVIDEAGIAVYRRLRDEGAITVRTDLLYKAYDRLRTERGIRAMQGEKSDDMLRFAGIKFMLDGGIEGARMREPYRVVPGEQPRTDYRGLLMTPPGGEDEFVEALTLVARAGLQAQTHGVGDEAIDVIARAYARTDAAVPIRDLRWTLMHAFLPSDEAIETLGRIGAPVTVQDHPVLLGHNQRRWWGDARAAASIPIRRLIDAGLLVGGGTDGPVVPIDPFLSIWWMVTRGTLLGYTLGPDQAITAREALELYTINNARIMGVDDELGSIEPGKRADLAVLSQDIVTVPPEDIRRTRALLTMVGGRVVHRDGM